MFLIPVPWNRPIFRLGNNDRTQWYSITQSMLSDTLYFAALQWYPPHRRPLETPNMALPTARLQP